MKKNNFPFHGHKTLLMAMEAAERSSVEAKKFLQDKRLTLSEKKLIGYLIQMRANDFSFIEEFTKTFNQTEPHFLQGLKHLVLGSVYIYKGHSVEAEEQLKLATSYLQESQEETLVKKMLFKSHLNLFYTYVNQKRFQEMKTQFEKTKQLEKLRADEISFMIMQVCYFSMIGNYNKAEETLDELREIKSEFNDIQVISFLMESFDLAIKLELFSKAESVLVEMKRHRTFRLSATYQYCLKLLNFLVKGETIYAYDEDFKGCPDLYYMIRVICSLDQGHKTEAEVYWEKLSQIAPETYQKNGFNFTGDKCLFSLCLNKCLSKGDQHQFELRENYTDQEKAFIAYFFSQGQSPLLKEELFKSVYGREPESKEDLAALAMLVFRINKKKELQFKSKKGSFYLAESKKISA